MNFKYDVDAIISLLARSLRAEVFQVEDKVEFKLGRVTSAGTIQLAVEKQELQAIVQSLLSMSTDDDLVLYDEFSYEILVRDESPFPHRRGRDLPIHVVDPEASLEYSISPATDRYLIWLLALAEDHGALRDLTFAFRRVEQAFRDEPQGLLEYLKGTSARFLTLKVHSGAKQSTARFVQGATAFLFQLAYNADIAMVRIRFFSEVSRQGRIRFMRRTTLEELDPPRRLYNEDLANHYVLAVSADSATVQYLSYYHILEHHFEAVFNDDLVEKIRTELTHPAFSYKRKKDINQLISTVRNSLKARSETITFSESEALRLTLLRYVDLDRLKAEIQNYDPTLIGYYRNTEVPFSNGCAVDLHLTDTQRVMRNLATRINKTRNSLVHSKDGDKARYIPFRDDHSLVMEIPLMRFIAEMVILRVSAVA